MLQRVVAQGREVVINAFRRIFDDAVRAVQVAARADVQVQVGELFRQLFRLACIDFRAVGAVGIAAVVQRLGQAVADFVEPRQGRRAGSRIAGLGHLDEVGHPTAEREAAGPEIDGGQAATAQFSAGGPFGRCVLAGGAQGMAVGVQLLGDVPRGHILQRPPLALIQKDEAGRQTVFVQRADDFAVKGRGHDDARLAQLRPGQGGCEPVEGKHGQSLEFSGLERVDETGHGVDAAFPGLAQQVASASAGSVYQQRRALGQFRKTVDVCGIHAFSLAQATGSCRGRGSADLGNAVN